jgi:ferredoxin
MAHICIHYFTGTGNTAHCVGLMTGLLEQKGHRVSICQVLKGTTHPKSVFDLHIIAFPVLRWAAPVLMKKYIRNMPDGLKTKTAMLAVNGVLIHHGKLTKGSTGQALEELEKILSWKGYQIILTGNASFPDNWTQTTNPCSIEDSKIIFPLGEAEVRDFIDKINREQTEVYRCGIFNRLWSGATALLFGVIGRRILGKFFIADAHCNGCSICAKACPAGTITMKNNRPRWAINCEDCNRCINICPEKAIQVSVPLLILQASLNVTLTVWVIKSIIVYFPKILVLERFPMLLLEITSIVIATLFLLWLATIPIDWLFRQVARIAIMNRFFSISYTRKFRRYLAPGFKPLSHKNTINSYIGG